MIYQTVKPIEIAYGWQHKRHTLPIGTNVTHADNLPGDGFWAIPDDSWPYPLWSWAEGYGILLNNEDCKGCLPVK